MASAAQSDFSKFNQVPLSALRMTSRGILSKHLNLEAMVPARNSYLPDYRGLAEMLGYDYLEIRNFERSHDRMGQILDNWLSGGHSDPTVGRLLTLVGELGRVDALEEVLPIVERDVQVWQENQAKLRSHVPVQDETVSQSSHDHDVNEFEYMTNDDVKTHKKTHYSAFVCSAIEDIQFVKEMIVNLEGKYGLRLCVPARDMLPGSSCNTVSARLIEQRCTKMVVVLSPNFLKSPECDFQIKVAQAISPGARSKKVIPILKEMCQLPNILRHITLCDYTKSDLKEWFWKRLANSVEMPVRDGAVSVDSEKLSLIELPSTQSGSWSSSQSSSSNNSSSVQASQSAMYATKC